MGDWDNRDEQRLISRMPEKYDSLVPVGESAGQVTGRLKEVM